MSWDERDKKRKHVWGDRHAEGPPDLEALLRSFFYKLRPLFGAKIQKEAPVGKARSPKPYRMWLGALLGLAPVLYGLSGIYIVGPAEEAVVMRFGRYVHTQPPGPHWIAPLIESKKIVNVQEVKTTKHGGQMLTQDENIVSVEVAVQWRVNQPRAYLFHLVQPEKTLRQVSESALRAVVGKTSLNNVLTTGRGEIVQEMREIITQTLNRYEAGIVISDLVMQQAKAPEEVRAAFDDAIKAQQDEERLVNEAQAYAHKIVPIAEGHAKRTLEEAKAYKEQVILAAKGRTDRFLKALPEYRQSPEVYRARVFLDAMEEVYRNTAKVLIDTQGNAPLTYLPLDKWRPMGGKQPSSGGKSGEEGVRTSRSPYPETHQKTRGGASNGS